MSANTTPYGPGTVNSDPPSSSSTDDGGYYNGGFWWTPAGMGIRYAIVALAFGILLLYFVGGYAHARRRMKKGLPPLAYHRWMVNRRLQPSYGMRYAQPHYGQNQGYQMENFAPGPPAYHNEEAPPPVYQPPQGSSKVMADQSFAYGHQMENGQNSGAVPGVAPPPATAHQ